MDIIQEVLFTEKECQEILSFVNLNEIIQSSVISNQNNGKVDVDFRNSKQFITNEQNLKNLVLSKINKFNVNSISNHMSILFYEVGSFFRKHIDRDVMVSETHNRYKTLIIHLNDQDEYAGGQMTVGDAIFTPKIGNVLLFDSAIPHEVSKVTEGVRKVLVTWLSYQDFKNQNLI